MGTVVMTCVVVTIVNVVLDTIVEVVLDVSITVEAGIFRKEEQWLVTFASLLTSLMIPVIRAHTIAERPRGSRSCSIGEPLTRKISRAKKKTRGHLKYAMARTFE